MSRRGQSKKAAQRAHAKRRARERYGLSMTRATFGSLIQKIQSGKATFLQRKSLRVSEWIVSYEGAEMRVIYDNKRKTIVTCLPHRMANNGVNNADCRAVKGALTVGC